MHHSLSKKQLREFGLLVGLVLPILIGWIIPAVGGHPFRIWTLWVALPVLMLGCFAPKTLRIPYEWWMALGHALGWVNSHLILGLVFLLVLQPIALFMRFFGYDPLKKNFSSRLTYREVRTSRKTDLNRIF